MPGRTFHLGEWLIGDLGEYRNESLRVTIPKEAREAYGLLPEQPCVLACNTSGFEVWNKDRWTDQFTGILRAVGGSTHLDVLEVKRQDIFRVLAATCQVSRVDKSGRVPVPDRLRKDFDGISKFRVVAIGACIEVFKPHAWSDYLKKTVSVWQVLDSIDSLHTREPASST